MNKGSMPSPMMPGERGAVEPAVAAQAAGKAQGRASKLSPSS